MALAISELALVEPVPKEPFWTTPEPDGTITQAIYTYGPNQHTRRRWFPWLNDGKGDKKVMPYSRADENSDWKNKAGDGEKAEVNLTIDSSGRILEPGVSWEQGTFDG